MNADRKPRMPIFRDRLDELRNGLSYADFAAKIGVSRATVGFYLAGDRVPDALTLRDIAEKCHISSDYLIGLSDAARPENRDISAITGLSDKSIMQLSRTSKKYISRTALNAIIEDGRILRHIVNYLCSFLEEERMNSRFKDVPLSRVLPTGYLEMNLVKLIEILPIWRKETVDELKKNPDVVEKMLLQYILPRVDEDECHIELGDFDVDDDPYIPNDDEWFSSEDYSNIYENQEYVKEYELQAEERNAAIREVLGILEKMKKIREQDSGHSETQ